MDKIKVGVCHDFTMRMLRDVDIVIKEHLTLSKNKEKVERWSDLFASSPDIIQTISRRLEIVLDRGERELPDNAVYFHTWWADSNDVLKSLRKAFGDLEIFILR